MSKDESNIEKAKRLLQLSRFDLPSHECRMRSGEGYVLCPSAGCGWPSFPCKLDRAPFEAKPRFSDMRMEKLVRVSKEIISDEEMKKCNEIIEADLMRKLRFNVAGKLIKEDEEQKPRKTRSKVWVPPEDRD